MTCFSGKCRLEEKVNQELLQTCFITEKKISDLTKYDGYSSILQNLRGSLWKGKLLNLQRLKVK